MDKAKKPDMQCPTKGCCHVLIGKKITESHFTGQLSEPRYESFILYNCPHCGYRWWDTTNTY